MVAVCVCVCVCMCAGAAMRSHAHSLTHVPIQLQVWEPTNASSSISCATDATDPGVATVSYWLTSQPTSSVSLTFFSTDEDLGVICGRSTLVFSVDNWATPQKLFVAAVANDRDDSSLYVLVLACVRGMDHSAFAVFCQRIRRVFVARESATCRTPPI